MAVSATQFETLFDKFVFEETSGQRLTSFLGNAIPKDTPNADYIFPEDGILIELKSLEKDHGGREYITKLVARALDKRGYPSSRYTEWMSVGRDLPSKVKRDVDSTVQNSLAHVVRKSNDQLRSSKGLLPSGHKGILLVANLEETLSGPVELLKCLAGNALKRTSLSIDAIVLITPGVTYVSNCSDPQHYVASVYRDEHEYLSDFINPMLQRWLDFEAAASGQTALVEKVHDIDEKSKSARPSLGKL